MNSEKNVTMYNLLLTGLMLSLKIVTYRAPQFTLYGYRWFVIKLTLEIVKEMR